MMRRPSSPLATTTIMTMLMHTITPMIMRAPAMTLTASPRSTVKSTVMSTAKSPIKDSVTPDEPGKSRGRRDHALEVGGLPPHSHTQRAAGMQQIGAIMSDPALALTNTFWPMVVEQTNRGERGYDLPS